MVLCRPERLDDVANAMRSSAHGIIARGAGLSYGDAALNAGGCCLLMGRLNRILAFDKHSAQVTCEPGVTFADLLAAFLPRGYVPPASPGTAHVTIGGAIAADVHGKDHEGVGSFGNNVISFELVRPDLGQVVVCRKSEPELFAATIGGMGLTGVVTSVTFQLVRSRSRAVRVRERRAKDLDALLQLLHEQKGRSQYSVCWLDALASGRSFGRGILQMADHEPSTLRPRRRRPMALPGMLGPVALNRAAMSCFNSLYYKRVPAAGRERMLPLDRFLYPLDGVKGWNRLYGRRGMLQFQCVLPDESSQKGIQQILTAVRGARAGPYLGVIKSLGDAGLGYLSFPMRGVTLALDFPRTDGAIRLVCRLNRLARDHGGRVYLAKDATMSPDDVRGMYPRLDRFREVLGAVDPHGRMQSDQSRRLGLRGTVAEACAA